MIRGRSVGYFGRESIIQVNCYAREPEWEQYRETFDSFADSFRFDGDKVYDPALEASSAINWSRIATRGAIGAVACGAFAILIAISRGRKPVA